jgi:para-nitrobenzyl esterase
MQGGPGAENGGPAPSEDCLYLNVWTPAGATSRDRLPVLVWIHGGAFRAGSISDPRTAGDLMARRGVIVVNIAYRLGVFGFLSHPQLSAESASRVSGNYGLLDQAFALKWVKRNIAAFGGDPAKVTIGGLSAGGISTAMLAAMPAARGDFRAIISMSGGSFAPPRSPAEAGENMEPLPQAEANGRAFAARLGATTLAALRSLPAERLLRADGQGVSWPVIDGVAVPGDEYRLYQQGKMADVPLLLGTTSDEGYNFSRIRTLAEYRTEVHRRYGRYAKLILSTYPANDDAQAVRQARDLLRDAMFGWGTFTWARLQSHHGRQPSWVYYFDHTPPRDGRVAADSGAIHGSDQPYPFGIAHQARAWTDTDRLISDAMLGYFVNFVSNGDPNGPKLPTWPRYTEADAQALLIGATMVPASAINHETLVAIDAYMTARRNAGTLGPP